MANELTKPPPAYLRELETIEDDLSATRYSMKLREEDLKKQQDDERRNRELMKLSKTERWTTEGLEMLTSIGAGALSNVTIRNFPIGGTLNGILGGVAKWVSVANPESMPVRVAARAGKTLLHSQVSIGVREILRGMP